MGDGSPFGIGRSAPIVRPPSPSSVRLPSKFVEGFLIHKSIPQYPTIARSAGQQGTVVLQATISKSGTIENLQVLSGPPMLQQAALAAVRQARYRPYLLNGQPTEVQTTITINFRMGG